MSDGFKERTFGSIATVKPFQPLEDQRVVAHDQITFGQNGFIHHLFGYVQTGHHLCDNFTSLTNQKAYVVITFG